MSNVKVELSQVIITASVDCNSVTVNIDGTGTVIATVSNTGPQGARGAGVAAGGTTGQILAKASNTDFDTHWINNTGGGGTESGEIITAGVTVNIASVTPGAPYNVIIRKTIGSPTQINLPAPNAATPWGRVNIKDGGGDAGTNNITVTPVSGDVDGQADFLININYQGQSFLDDGTTWNVQN